MCGVSGFACQVCVDTPSYYTYGPPSFAASLFLSPCCTLTQHSVLRGGRAETCRTESAVFYCCVQLLILYITCTARVYFICHAFGKLSSSCQMRAKNKNICLSVMDTFGLAIILIGFASAPLSLVLTFVLLMCLILCSLVLKNLLTLV